MKTRCGSLQTQTMQNESSNFVKCLFQVHILQKAKLASFTKIHPSQKNGNIVQGNVIQIAYLFTLIENKKL